MRLLPPPCKGGSRVGDALGEAMHLGAVHLGAWGLVPAGLCGGQIKSPAC
jgi:hypothetical protein